MARDRRARAGSDFVMGVSPLQTGVTGTGDANIDQRVAQTNPLTPQSQKVLVGRLLLLRLQLRHLQLAIEPSDAVLQLAGYSGGATVEHASIRVVIVESAFQKLRPLHHLRQLAPPGHRLRVYRARLGDLSH